MGLGAWGLGFGVWGLGFRVWGLGLGVWALGFGVEGSGCSSSPQAHGHMDAGRSATPPEASQARGSLGSGG